MKRYTTDPTLAAQAQQGDRAAAAELVKPYVQDADFTLFNGDALEVLRELPEASVHCCVTSPPFYGLRDYGVEGQIGLEATPEAWVARLVAVFREVRRVLRPDGTLWIECGDSYTSGGRDNYGPSKPDKNIVLHNAKRPPQPPGLKPKDLIGTPWLLAFALRADGWWLRQANIWWHTNCLPESAKDRPTSAHSYVFLFSPSARYFYDQVAVQEPAAWDRWGAQTNKKNYGLDGKAGAHKIKERSRDEAQAIGQGSRNLRSVWPIPTQGTPEAHFATMPEAVVRPCILAGTSERGCCPECGAPFVRETETEYVKSPVHSAGSIVGSRSTTASGGSEAKGRANKETIHAQPRVNRVDHTTGWRPSCDHVEVPGSLAAGDPPLELTPEPCTVLDPFGGAGTTALVARKHGRRSLLIELSLDYCALAARRLSQQSLLTEIA